MTSASEAIGRPPEDEWHPAAPDRVLAAAALGIAFALCLPALAGLSHMLQRVEFYAHGYLIPLVAAYLAYGKRRQISEALRQLHPPRYGALIAFGAAVFEGLMLVGDVGFAGGVGVPIVLGAPVPAGGGCGQRGGGAHMTYEMNTPFTNPGLTLLDKVGVHLDRIADSTGRLTDL